ncbi:MAG TPA: DUF4252 domain-containing protein [Salinivirga sp.]|uniref:DUF4252 domain-containing protein n=1 Tax=Salinivirga sp. TaxID=1970192 RepID=UPI002B482354|nr:DUF4252 domain-containing protein [Salinivirga sp.]HKK60117.1 DUF4252 domain-containing protein [Salinivirga sp.]
MKNLTIIILLFMTVVNADAQSIKAIFDKHIGEGNYTTVTINGALFQLAAEYAEDKEEADVAKGIEGIRVFSAEECGNHQAKKALMKELWSFFDNSVYKEFMRVEEKYDKVVFYMKKSGEKIIELTLVAEDDASVIQITGDINLADIAKISKTMNVQGMENLEEIEE